MTFERAQLHRLAQIFLDVNAIGRVVAELRRIDLQVAAAAATPTGFLEGAFRTLQQQVGGDTVDRKNRYAATDRPMPRANVARDGAPDHEEELDRKSVV